MSLLSVAERLNTANQLNNWNTSCINSMNNAKSTFTSIVNQRLAMENNPEFTQEDKDEVDAMLNKINELAKTLIATENI
jgi:hypothetical protein